MEKGFIIGFSSRGVISTAYSSPCEFFKYSQPEPLMCETTCVKNILDELLSRHSNRTLTVSLKILNGMYQYNPIQGVDTEVGIENFNKHFSHLGYQMEKSFGRKTTIKSILDIISNEERSYPIVSLSPKYFTHEDLGYSISEDADGIEYEHALVVVNANEDAGMISLCDPWKKRNRGGSDSITPDQNINIPKFIEYWSETKEANWMVWIERKVTTLDRWSS